jgi:nucleoside-diphosphate-sugar epimerase
MKVLVTGGTGFVGSHTAKALKDAGHFVRLLVRSESKAKTVFQNLNTDIDEFIIGDITNNAAVTKAVTGCDAVIHTAAMVSTAEKYADEVYKTNVGGTQLVIDCSLAANVKKIIYVSSVSALFNVNDTVMNENSPVSTATNPYGRTKVVCEQYVRDLQAKGAPIIITYPTGVVGSHDPGLSEPHYGLKMFVGHFTFTSSTGMQFVNVRDIANAHVAILERVEAPDRFMLGGNYYSWNELLDITKKITGRKFFYIHIPGKALRLLGKCADLFIKLTGKELPITGEGMIYASQWVYADSSKIEKELGLEFSCREETLAEVIRCLYEGGHLSAKKAGKLASK